MYLDVKGLVTTGMGNLIDSIADAQALPWYKPDGTKASANEIGAAWSLVKGRQDMKLQGGGHFSGITDLRLHDDGIQQLINSKLNANETILVKRFPGYPAWPADAQMGLQSMAWAMGANFNFPSFQAAVNTLVPDFTTAAKQSHMNDVGNPGLVPRNAANFLLFTNAQSALDNNLPHDVLQWSQGLATAVAAAIAPDQAAAQAADVVLGAAAKVPTPIKAIVGGVLFVLGAGFTIWAAKKG